MSDTSFQRLSDGPVPEPLRGGVVAIGNFDGVHRGHQAVLDRALQEAARRGVPAVVLTFQPHPRTVFRPDVPLFILTPPPMKARLIQALGFAAVVEYPFDRDFAGQSAEDFITKVLDADLGISHAVTGFDFHFGKNRQGGPAYLMEAGERHGFGVTGSWRKQQACSAIAIRSRPRSLGVSNSAGRWAIPRRIWRCPRRPH